MLTGNLPMTAVQLLVAPNTPREAVKEIAERVKSGERPDVAEVKKTIRRAKRNDNGNADTETDNDADRAQRADDLKVEIGARRYHHRRGNDIHRHLNAEAAGVEDRRWAYRVLEHRHPGRAARGAQACRRRRYPRVAKGRRTFSPSSMTGSSVCR